MKNVIVIGGGAAGMLAAIEAARNGNKVTLIEKNEKLGKKIFITGKGRCNLTNACDRDEFFSNLISNPRFLYSSFSMFNNFDTMAFFEELGLKIKTERGNRVFPESDKSSDVIAVLANEVKKQKVKVLFNTVVKEIIQEDSHFKKVITEDNQVIEGDACIIATGGKSYASTGSTGDGYKFAKQLGHSVTDLHPSLAAIRLREDFIQSLEGLSLRNVKLSVTAGNKEIFSDFGECVFTSCGISGPLALSASAYLIKYLGKEIILHIDLKPALSFEQLDNRIIKDFETRMNKQFRNSLDDLLPQKLVLPVIAKSEIDPYKQVNSITKTEREKLLEAIKNFSLTFSELSGYNEAVITQGGINVKEINPSTMESKIIKGIYFAGEVIDVDALTGGFNLQIAWTTGFSAGCSAGME